MFDRNGLGSSHLGVQTASTTRPVGDRSGVIIRRALVQDLYVVSFFRKYLRGEDDHFLDGAPAAWPEVDVFLKK